MKGWRTLAFNLLVAVLGVAVVFDWTTVIPPEWMGVTMVVIAAANGVLRLITTTPVGKSR